LFSTLTCSWQIKYNDDDDDVNTLPDSKTHCLVLTKKMCFASHATQTFDLQTALDVTRVLTDNLYSVTELYWIIHAVYITAA